MSQLEDWIRDAMRQNEEEEAGSPPLSTELTNHFLQRSRWVAGFAWMKMVGTMTISTVAAIVFFTLDTTQAQIACAAVFLVGFIGFGIWWLWYWMVLNRNATLREIKRVELQLAELRDMARAS